VARSNTTIWQQFDKAFGDVSAYVLLDDQAEVVGRVCFKYPRDGAGRLWCYVQVWGEAMARGYAGGYGYDKQSAAFVSACDKLQGGGANTLKWQSIADDGHGWKRNLETLGYKAIHAIDRDWETP
jgi:hypothetical protein